MTVRPLVIVGAGEHARVVADAATASGLWTVAGYTDLRPAVSRTGVAGPGLSDIPYLGTDQEVVARSLDDREAERPWLILGFGGPTGHRQAAVAVFGDSWRWATIIHPSAWVSSGAALGPGTVVLAGAVVNVGASVGAHVIINSRAVVEHDVRVGDLADLAPGVVIGGGSSVGPEAIIGISAAIRDHVTIGARSTVAMGAVVVRDVAPGTTVIGAPARVRDGDGGG